MAKTHKKEAHGHSHEENDHGHSHAPKKFLGLCTCTDTIRISCMLSMTLTFFLVELIVGQISNSISLTADAFHMLSDSLALIIGLVTAIMSKRTSTKNTYGWVRAEVLGPLVNSVFLCTMCLSIVIEAVERLFDPHELTDLSLLLYTGSLGLLINLLGMFVFGHGHSHSVPHDLDQEVEGGLHSDDDDVSEICEILEKGNNSDELNEIAVQDKLLTKKVVVVTGEKVKKQAKSKSKCCAILSSEANMNMRAVFIHALADALGSVIVIISALMNKYQSQLHIPKPIINYIDPVLCLSLVTLILSTALPLLKESALILLQTVPKHIEVESLKQDLLAHVPGILNVHELHIWKLSGRKVIATAHVICHNSSEYMLNAAKIKAFFHRKGIHSTTIQPEFTDPVAGISMEEACMIECVTNCVQNTCCGVQAPLVVRSDTTKYE